MSPLRQAIGGIGLLLAVVIILAAGFGFAFSDAQIQLPASAATLPTAAPLIEPTTAAPEPTVAAPTATTQPTELLPTSTASSTATMETSQGELCEPPATWESYSVGADDSLQSLAQSRGITAASLKSANCLESDELTQGMIIFVPPASSATPEPTSSPTTVPASATATNQGATCGHDPGWILYSVVAGDTLFNISQRYGISVSTLKWANCLGSSNVIIVGQNLWVPNVATRTPSPSASPTQTASPIPGTETPTPTSTDSPTATPTATATTVPATATSTGTTRPPTPTWTPTVVP